MRSGIITLAASVARSETCNNHQPDINYSLLSTSSSASVVTKLWLACVTMRGHAMPHNASPANATQACPAPGPDTQLLQLVKALMAQGWCSVNGAPETRSSRSLDWSHLTHLRLANLHESDVSCQSWDPQKSQGGGFSHCCVLQLSGKVLYQVNSGASELLGENMT